MKSIVFLMTFTVAVSRAQTPAPQAPKPPVPPPAKEVVAHVDGSKLPLPSADTVIATMDGRKLTYGEVEKYLHALPPQMQQNAVRNRKAFLQQFALMLRLTEMAEKSRLDQQSPYKESLEFNRMTIMSQAQINDAYQKFVVLPAEQQSFYDANKDRYTQVKLKVIYIAFHSTAAAPTGANGTKALTEEEAKAKAEQLLKQIRQGADFVKLAKENSDDATSVAKDGDFGTISRSDNLPDAIRSVVFSLKPGEMSEPVRQPNGFYLFRAEAVSGKSFSEVRDQIYTELKNTRLKEWMDSTTKGLNIQFENEGFFPAAAPVPNTPPRTGK